MDLPENRHRRHRPGLDRYLHSHERPTNPHRPHASTPSDISPASSLDGQLATTGASVLHYPGTHRSLDHGLAIGSDTSGANIAYGIFDWMQTWNYPVTANTISDSYRSSVQRYPGLDGGGGGDWPQMAPGDDFFDPGSTGDSPVLSGDSPDSLSTHSLRLVLQPAGAMSASFSTTPSRTPFTPSTANPRSLPAHGPSRKPSPAPPARTGPIPSFP